MITQYPIPTYETYYNKDKHEDIAKIERISTWLNDISYPSNTVIGGYNNYIQRAKQPVLKMTGMVLPFEVLRFIDKNEEEKNSDTEKIQLLDNEFKSLAGSKINNLVLLLDVSASMKNDKKLKKLKNSITYLIDLLRKEDKLSIIIYSENPKVLFSSDGEYKKSDLKILISQLKTGGRTNTKKGLLKAYQLCNKLKVLNGNNRIIIATDGFFKIDKKDKTLIKNNVVKEIYLSAFHYESSKRKKKEEKMLQKMARLGQGVYKLIMAEEDAIKALVGEAKQTN